MIDVMQVTLDQCPVVSESARFSAPVSSAERAAISAARQCKVEDIDILGNPIGIRRLWDWHYPKLDVPAQHDLSRRLAVLGARVVTVGLSRRSFPWPSGPHATVTIPCAVS